MAETSTSTTRASHPTPCQAIILIPDTNAPAHRTPEPADAAAHSSRLTDPGFYGSPRIG